MGGASAEHMTDVGTLTMPVHERSFFFSNLNVRYVKIVSLGDILYMCEVEFEAIFISGKVELPTI